jgi:hypothetical protein
MKKFLLICFLFMGYSCLVTYSQFEYYKPDTTRNEHRKGDFMVALSPNLLLNTPNGAVIAGGLKIQVFISRRFSLDADLVFSRDYIHGGPGLIGLPIGLLVLSTGMESESFSESLTGLVVGVIAVAAAFEHISYHIPLKSNLDISPYVSILRYRYSYKYGVYSDPDFVGEQLSFASGVQMNKYFGRFVLSPYAEYNVGYRDHIPGYNFGVYFGMYFINKKNLNKQASTF